MRETQFRAARALEAVLDALRHHGDAPWPLIRPATAWLISLGAIESDGDAFDVGPPRMSLVRMFISSYRLFGQGVPLSYSDRGLDGTIS